MTTQYARRLGRFGPRRTGQKTHVIVVPIIDGLERAGWPSCQSDRGRGAYTIPGDPADATCRICAESNRRRSDNG